MADTIITLPQHASVSAMAAIRAECLSALKRIAPGSNLVLDAGQVQHADSSLAQLIVSLRAEAARGGILVSVSNKDEVAFLHTLTSSDMDSCHVVSKSSAKPEPSGGAA